MDVEIPFFEKVLRDVPRFGLAPDVAERGLGALLHDLAERTGELEFALAGHGDHLHRQDRAAAAGPRHAGGAADLRFAVRFVGQEFARAQKVADHRGGHGDPARRRKFADHDPVREFSAHLSDGAFELAHARLAGVAADDLVDRRDAERDPLFAQPALVELARDQVAAGDLALFERGVARQFDDLHAVAQRSGNGVEHVRRSQEKHPAQVVVDFQIMVLERVVLLRIEHFEQCRRRIAAHVVRKFVDLIQQEHRIDGPGALHALDDPPRQCADVGPSVAADLRFVMHAAQRGADEFPVHGAGDRLPERGLADAGRPHEAQNRRLAVRLELEDGEEFEDAVLHLPETVMVLVEDARRIGQIERVERRFAPRHVEQPLDVVVRDMVFRHRLRHEFEAGEFLADFRLDALRQTLLLELLLDRLDVRIAEILVELLPDHPQLFAQEIFALGLAHRLVDFALDLAAEFLHFDFAVQPLQQHLAAPPDRTLLQEQQFLLPRKMPVVRQQFRQMLQIALIGGGDPEFVRDRQIGEHQLQSLHLRGGFVRRDRHRVGDRLLVDRTAAAVEQMVAQVLDAHQRPHQHPDRVVRQMDDLDDAGDHAGLHRLDIVHTEPGKFFDLLGIVVEHLPVKRRQPVAAHRQLQRLAIGVADDRDLRQAVRKQHRFAQHDHRGEFFESAAADRHIQISHNVSSCRRNPG